VCSPPGLWGLGGAHGGGGGVGGGLRSLQTILAGSPPLWRLGCVTQLSGQRCCSSSWSWRQTTDLVMGPLCPDWRLYLINNSYLSAQQSEQCNHDIWWQDFAGTRLSNSTTLVGKQILARSSDWVGQVIFLTCGYSSPQCNSVLACNCCWQVDGALDSGSTICSSHGPDCSGVPLWLASICARLGQTWWLGH
jgi:hypothetical protein